MPHHRSIATKRRLVTGASIVWLAALTALAIYALVEIHNYSLPIANIFAALTVALPPLAGIALEAWATFQARHATTDGGTLQTSPVFLLLSAVFLIFEVALATLAGTHIAPAAGLSCPLQERWQHMFSMKDAGRIQHIQDGFNCCGFKSPRDMAFPFPPNPNGAEACMVRYERNTSCAAPWTALERKVGAMLLVVPIGVFLWKLVLYLSSGRKSSWLPSTIRLPIEDSEAGNNITSRLIGGSGVYHPADEVQEEEDEVVEDEITSLNRDSELASRVEQNRNRSSQGTQERGIWNQD